MQVSIINHFNESGVYTGSSIQETNGEYATVGALFQSQRQAEDYCDDHDFEIIEILEDEI